MEITIAQIEKVCKDMTEQVEVYFKMLEEHECLDRIDKREQFVMKMMPTVFKNRIYKLIQKKTEKKQ